MQTFAVQQQTSSINCLLCEFLKNKNKEYFHSYNVHTFAVIVNVLRCQICFFSPTSRLFWQKVITHHAKIKLGIGQDLKGQCHAKINLEYTSIIFVDDFTDACHLVSRRNLNIMCFSSFHDIMIIVFKFNIVVSSIESLLLYGQYTYCTAHRKQYAIL